MPRFSMELDQLARQLGQGTTRRSIIRTLAVSAAAPMLAAVAAARSPEPADARKRKPRQRCKRVQQVCAASSQCCQGRRCLNNGCAGTAVCCSPSGGRCAVDCDCCGSSICNFITGTCL